MLYEYALRFVGVPYRWGGQNPLVGFDCSGLVRHLLHSQGVSTDSPGTAQALHTQFQTLPCPRPTLGALVFYCDAHGVVDHVALCLTEHLQLEAAGGDHTTTSLQRAIEQDAFVRVTPIRSNHVGIFRPAYPFPT